jgi:hypothetical protein
MLAPVEVRSLAAASALRHRHKRSDFIQDDERFGTRRQVCSMTWGSASADRSIIASRSLPRTPVPPPIRAGTLGHPERGRRSASAHRTLIFEEQGRSTSSEEERHCTKRVRRTTLFGAPDDAPQRGLADGALRSTAREISPGKGTRSASAQRATHPKRSELSTWRNGPPVAGPSKQHPSGGCSRSSTGTGNRTSSEVRAPVSAGQDRLAS